MIKLEHHVLGSYDAIFKDTCITCVSPNKEVSVERIALKRFSNEVDFAHHYGIVVLQLDLRKPLKGKLRICQERLPHLLNEGSKPHFVELLKVPENEESIVFASPCPHELLELLVPENN